MRQSQQLRSSAIDKGYPMTTMYDIASLFPAYKALFNMSNKTAVLT